MTGQGFTLLEMLVIIAIIAILATALIPSLLNARMAANNNAAQTAVRNAATMAEILRSNTSVDTRPQTQCAPLLFSQLDSNVSSCYFRQDANSTYVLGESKSGAYYLYDGQTIQGPLSAPPASW